MLSVDLSRGWAEILRGCEVLMKLGKCVFLFKENHGINYKITHISAESKEIYIESSTGKKVDILTFEDFEKVVQVLQEQGSFVYGSTPPRGLPTRSKLAVIEFCHPQMMYMSEDDCVVIISPSDAKRWFSAERVRNAVQHLNEFGTLNFLDVAIVLAVNGVNQVNFINPNEKNEGGISVSRYRQVLGQVLVGKELRNGYSRELYSSICWAKTKSWAFVNLKI